MISEDSQVDLCRATKVWSKRWHQDSYCAINSQKRAWHVLYQVPEDGEGWWSTRCQRELNHLSRVLQTSYPSKLSIHLDWWDLLQSLNFQILLLDWKEEVWSSLWVSIWICFLCYLRDDRSRRKFLSDESWNEWSKRMAYVSHRSWESTREVL